MEAQLLFLFAYKASPPFLSFLEKKIARSIISGRGERQRSLLSFFLSSFLLPCLSLVSETQIRPDTGRGERRGGRGRG